ncbi:MAG: hypothetical protein EOO29_28310 [Comamonadaceae bacterium]|nr:MAG: hypothetical protein EOO29_28310 [Comamonadaceae bacterium]
MNKTLIAAALSFFAVAGAHAEEYQGVLEFQGQLSRAEVQAQAVTAAHARNQNIPAHAVSMAALPNARDRASVQSDAVAAAHNPRQNLNVSAFVNSTAPDTYLAAPAANAVAGVDGAPRAQ